MNNKLSLIVNFAGTGDLTSHLRNIVGLGKKGSRSLNALRGEGRRLESQLRNVRKEITRSSGNITELIERERQLERAIDGVNSKMERQKRLNAIEGDRRAMIARGEDLKSRGRDNVTTGAAILAPLAAMTTEAAKFSSGMVDIQQKTDLSDAAADRLAKRIITMSRAAKTMPEEIRSGLDLLLAKGMGLEEAEAAIGPAGRIATAYKVNLTDAAAAANSSIKNLKVPASETARIFDMMAMAGNEGAFEVRNMARHFPALTAQMQALGEKGAPAVADLSAALQVAMHTAGSEDEAGNNVKNLLAKINAPGTIRAFEKNFGVNLPAAMKKLTDEGYSSLEAIALVTKQATGGDMKKLGFAFEDMQARQGIMALIQNLDEYRDIRSKALNSGGTVDDAFNQRVAKDATVQWTDFKGSMQSAAIILGGSLLPAVKDVFSAVSSTANAVAQWAQKHPEAAGFIMKSVLALGAFKVGLGATQMLLGGVLGPMANFISITRKLGGVAKIFGVLRTAALFLGSGLMKAGAMMLANPIILIITAIVAAIGVAGYLIYKNWDTIKAAFNAGLANLSAAWNWIKSTFMRFPALFGPIGIAVHFVIKHWDAIKEGFWTGVRAVGQALAWVWNTLSKAFELWYGLHAKAAQIGRDIITGLANGILAAPGKVWNALKSVVMGGIDRVKDFLGIKSPSRVFMAIGGHTVEGLARGIEDARKRPVRAMGRLAAGVTAAGSLALTPMTAGATAGPPAQRAAATPPPAMAGRGKIEIHIHQLPGQDAKQLAKEVKRELERLDGIAARGSYEDDA